MSLAGRLRRSTYLLDFLYSFQFGLVLYFNSSFLGSHGFSARDVGFVFACSYALAIVLLLLAPRLLRRFGNRRLFISGASGAGLLFSLLAMSAGAATTALFIGALALSMALYLSLDVFLETTSANEKKTGGRRGFFNAIKNGGFIAAQLAAGMLIAYGFAPLYVLTGAVLLGIAFVASVLMRTFRDKPYGRPDWRGVLRRLRRNRDLRSVFYLQFLLRLFYATMVVYTPLYLHEYVGLPLESLGTIFALMLVPFILLEAPLGRLEDTRWGEREVLVFGCTIMAISTALIPLIASTATLTWALILFTTRVGAVLLEIGSEAFFFKHVDGRDSGEVSAFRMLYPLAYIVGPLASSALLVFVPLQYLFVALAAVVLTGIIATRRLRDTR